MPCGKSYGESNAIECPLHQGEYLSVCPDCGGSMRVIAALTEPGSIRRRLEGMGLSWPVPPIAPAGPEFHHPEEAPPDALDRSSDNPLSSYTQVRPHSALGYKPPAPEAVSGPLSATASYPGCGHIDGGRSDHPKVSPVLQDMYGGPPSTDGEGQPDREVSFRIDHINVHNWCRPSFIAQHPQYAADCCTLHGGGNSGGTPDLPPNNESADNNQFFRVDEGRFSNGLISVVFELEDTTANGGGFCCVPGSHKQNFPLPQDMRRVADLPDLADEEWLQGVPAEAGDCIVFTEALIHSTVPWRLQTRRRTLFYKFSSRGGSNSKRYYNVEDYEQYPDLTDRQRAILAPPD